MFASLALVALVALTGCAAKQAGPVNSESPAATITSEMPSPVPSETPSPVPATERFGTWVTLQDGVAVLVTQPTRLPQEAGRSYPTVGFTVRIRNGSLSVIDVGSTSVTMTWGPNGDQALETARSHHLTGVLPPARIKSADYEFDLPASGTTVLGVEVQVADHPVLYFEGAVK